MAATRTKQDRDGRQHMTVSDICDELSIPRSTFYEWRTKKIAPPCIKLPNGEIRIRRDDLERWLEARQERRS